ncbi:MAG: RnfABCDGE type electron transport complex subunit D, partial [Clostridia bacterium]|nr:RnfABCDGE type electron transport complex subunit D [Clostridia bacterium]
LDLHNGCIGEASAICVLIGFVYLLVRRVITPLIPCVYIGSTVVFVVLLQLITGHAADLNLTFVIVQMCGGGLLLGACFMANDYVTSPLSRTGQLIYGLVLGLLTSLFRILGSSSEGVSYAIIIGNCVVPLIDRVTIPRPFGREKEKKIRKEGQA